MINQDDFVNFEKTILNQENTPSVKYKIDHNMESAIRFQFLCDTYGKDKVQSTLEELKFSFLDIADPQNFLLISEKIKE